MNGINRMILVCCGLWTFKASAEVYNLQLTGTILSRTCEVESQTQNVDIGQFAASDFTSIGSISAAKAFNIHLSGCGSAAVGAEIRFSGTADKDNPTLLALAGKVDGLAKGIAVEILDNHNQTVAINNAAPLVYSLLPGDNALAFALRYKSTQKVVTPGDGSAVMYFDLQYQ